MKVPINQSIVKHSKDLSQVNHTKDPRKEQVEHSKDLTKAKTILFLQDVIKVMKREELMRMA